MTTDIDWQPVPSIPGYEVSNTGAVRSYWTNHGMNRTEPRVLKPRRSNGYLSYELRVAPSESKCFYAHRLVALAFHGPPPFPRADASHKNDVRDDNRVENIEWATRSWNMRTAVSNSRLKVGQNSPNAKLTSAKVAEMRRLYGVHGVSTAELGRMFGISQSWAYRIVHRQAWSHLADPPMT